jgi:hypothetical protein
MVVKQKTYFVDKNIETVKNDLNKLIRNKSILDAEDTAGIKVFDGKIQDNRFKLCEPPMTRLNFPETEGTLFEENSEKTRIEINIHFSLFHIFIDIFWIALFSLLIIFGYFDMEYIQAMPPVARYLVFSFVILLFPAGDNIHYFYHLNKILKNLEYYMNGYYVKYIKDIG